MLKIRPAILTDWMIPAIGIGTAFPCHVSILFSLFSFANLWPSSFIYFLSLSKEQGPVHQGRTHCLCHGVRRQGRGDRGQVLRAAWHCRDCSRQGRSQPLGDGAGKQVKVSVRWFAHSTKIFSISNQMHIFICLFT